MSVVRLSGRLVCASEEEAARVRRHLTDHVGRTRAEVGCISFDVEPTEDPLIWSVEERFVDGDAFESHQRRVATSDWGRATAGIARQYTIEGLTR